MARDVLADLARRAAQQPVPGGSGRFGYVRTSGRQRGARWRSGGAVLQPGAGPEWLDTARELWTARDGSGRIEETRSGRRTTASKVYPPGGLSGLIDWPTDPDELRQAVVARYGPAYRPLKTVASVWFSQPLDGPVRAGLLHLLSTVPGIEVVDRGAVAEVAVRLARRTLVFDAGTGGLLASERDHDGGLSYRHLLAAGYVDTTEATAVVYR